MCAGDVASGKTTLVARLQGVEEYMKGRGLEYLYFNVHDEDVDGENFNTYLERHNFNTECVNDPVLSACASMC